MATCVNDRCNTIPMFGREGSSSQCMGNSSQECMTSLISRALNIIRNLYHVRIVTWLISSNNCYMLLLSLISVLIVELLQHVLTWYFGYVPDVRVIIQSVRDFWFTFFQKHHIWHIFCPNHTFSIFDGRQDEWHRGRHIGEIQYGHHTG